MRLGSDSPRSFKSPLSPRSRLSITPQPSPTSWAPPVSPIRRRLAVATIGTAILASVITGPAQSSASPPASGSATTARATASTLARTAPVTPAHLRIYFRLQAHGFAQPIWTGTPPDSSGRMFVAERRGTIRVFLRGHVQRGYYLDLRRYVNSSGGEQGLLGVAFSPRFATSPYIWVTYTSNDNALVLARVKATRASSSRVSTTTLRTVLVVPHPGQQNHNGGQIGFNADGLLYLGTGDGGGGGDPNANAQNRRSLSGKMLRIIATSRCGTRRYCIPPSNPYARSGSFRREILHIGLRNPWRWSFDSVTHAQWIGDVGQDRWEEVNYASARARGLNFGWSCREGRHTYNSTRCSSGTRYINPAFERCHPDNVAGCTELTGAEALIGGYVYRGTKYASLAAGTYVAGDFVTGNVVAYRSGVVSRIGSARGLTAFGAGPGQELWIVTYDGRLMRVGFYAR